MSLRRLKQFGRFWHVSSPASYSCYKVVVYYSNISATEYSPESYFSNESQPYVRRPDGAAGCRLLVRRPWRIVYEEEELADSCFVRFCRRIVAARPLLHGAFRRSNSVLGGREDPLGGSVYAAPVVARPSASTAGSSSYKIANDDGLANATIESEHIIDTASRRTGNRRVSVCEITHLPLCPRLLSFGNEVASILLQRAQCSHFKRCISYSNSVCLSVRPSVCPSVRPSHAGIVSKRRHVARCSLHRWIAKCV